MELLKISSKALKKKDKALGLGSVKKKKKKDKGEILLEITFSFLKDKQ